MREFTGVVEVDATPREVIRKVKSRIEPMHGMLNMYVKRGKAVFHLVMASNDVTMEMDAVDGKKPVYLKYKFKDRYGKKIKNPTGARIWTEKVIGNTIAP